MLTITIEPVSAILGGIAIAGSIIGAGKYILMRIDKVEATMRNALYDKHGRTVFVPRVDCSDKSNACQIAQQLAQEAIGKKLDELKRMVVLQIEAQHDKSEAVARYQGAVEANQKWHKEQIERLHVRIDKLHLEDHR